MVILQRAKLFFLVAAFLCFSAGWLLPNHYYPWVSAYQEFSAFLGLLSLLLVGFAAGSLVFPKVFVFLLFVACIPLVQYLWGVVVFFEEAFVASLYVIGFLLMLLVGRNQTSTEIVLALAWALLFSGVVSVGIALAQWQLINASIWIVDIPLGGRPFANIAQPNNLASLLLLSAIAVAYLHYKQLMSRWLVVLLWVFLIFGVALTQSRTPFAFFAVLGVVYLLFWRRTVQQFPGRAVLLVFILYVIFYFMVPVLTALSLLSGEGIAERFLGNGRLAIWQQMITALFVPQAWLGYGWGQIAHAQLAAVNEGVLGGAVTEYAHSIVLDILLWNGWVLGSLILAAGTFFCWQLVRSLRSVEAVFGFVFALVIVVHGLLEFPYAYAYFLLPLGFFVGVASTDMPLSVWRVRIRWQGVLLFVLSGVTLWGWIFYEYRILEEDYRLMRFENLNIGTLRAEHKAPDVILLDGIREFIRFARTKPSEAMTPEELEWMRDVAYKPPYLPSLIRYAVSLGLNEQHDSAASQVLLIKRLYGESGYAVTVDYIKGLSVKYASLKGVLLALGED